MKKNLFEIFLTKEYVCGEEWLQLFLKVSKINGLFRPWNLIIRIENNYIKYYIEIKRMLPPILGELGSFLLKKTTENLNEKFSINLPYILTSNYKTILDVYDRFETKKMQKLKTIKVTFYPHKIGSYLSTTKIYLKKENNKIIRKKVLFNFSIFEFVSVDFGTHIRFFYQKDNTKYLETKKVMNLLKNDEKNALLIANVFPYLQENLFLNHSDYDFFKHSIVIGASGTGKSKLISAIVKNLSFDKNNDKYKVIVIDPHSSIEDDIGGLEKCKVIDFKTEEDSIDLFVNGTEDILASTESIIAILKNIIADRYNSRLERVLRYSIHLLLEKGEFNLISLRKLLTEIEYRNKIIKDVQDTVQPNIIEFFKVDFNELKTKSYQESIAPIVSFIDEMQLLPAFSNIEKLSNIKDEIQDNFATIFSLDQTTLGLNITKTISGFAMQSILQLVQAHTFNEHIILIIDEVSLIENPIINRFLSEARKYNLSLILASQYFEQISQSLQKAIFTNIVNYFVFRVSRMDAILLENNIKMEVAVKNSHINKVKILTELEDRECIVRIGKDGKLYSAFKGKTANFIPIPRKKSKKKTRKNFSKDTKIENKKAFCIDTKNTLKDIMKKQSASRKKINFENNS